MNACRVLLDDDVAESLRDAVFAAVKRDELADAVSAMARLARSPDDRARELVLSRYRGVRRYLPALLDTITFLANDAGEPILAALARDVCHGHRGELRQRYREGQEEQLGALGLIVNAIVLYNTIYTQRALDHLAATGMRVDDVDVERLSPRPHHADRSLPHRAPRRPTRPRRLPQAQHHAGRGG